MFLELTHAGVKARFNVPEQTNLPKKIEDKMVHNEEGERVLRLLHPDHPYRQVKVFKITQAWLRSVVMRGEDTIRENESQLGIGRYR